MPLQKECIVVVTPGFPKDEGDTTCLPLIQQIVLSLQSQYAPRSIIVLSFQYPFITQSYYWKGIKVISIGGKNKAKLFRLITWIKAYFKLLSIKKEYDLKGLLSIFHTECALVSSVFSKRNKVKYFSWLQGQDAKAENQFVKKINASGESIIALSVFLQNEFYKNHSVKPQYIINNGIDPSIFPVLNTRNRSIDILGVGSLIPLKNYSLFIELVGELKEQFPKIHTAIAGDGVEKKNLQVLINSLGLQDNVTLLGLKSHITVLELMNNSNIVLHTSRYEGSCSVLFEALYSGCSVISTCNPSNVKNTKFVHATTRQQLKEALVLSLQNKEHIRERFLFNTIANSSNQLISLFN